MASFWTIAPAVVGGLVTLPYWLVPALIHRAQRLPLVMRLEPAGPAELAALDEATLNALELAVHDLGALGFDRATAYRAVDGMATNVGVLFEHPEHGDLATFSVMSAPGVPAQSVVIFESEWADAFRVLTANSGVASALPASPLSDDMTLPTLRDPALLYRAHRGRVERVRRPAERRRLTRGDDALAEERRRQAENRRRYVQNGYMQLDGDVVRPTVVGACLMTWRLLFPWKNVQLRARDRSEAALLRELGIAPA